MGAVAPPGLCWRHRGRRYRKWGERFASLPEEMGLVLGELEKRGLLYVDPRPGSQPPALVWGRSVDVIVDEPPTAADIENQTGAAGAIARAKGSALGFAGTPRSCHSPATGDVGGEPPGRWARACASKRIGAGADRPMSGLPYRPNVGAVLFNRDGKVFVARRADLPNAEGSRRRVAIAARWHRCERRPAASPCCVNWRKRSAQRMLRSSESIPTG